MTEQTAARPEPADAVGADTADRTTSRLEEEGEIAADYLEEFLDIVDLDGDIELDIDHGRAAVEIVAESDSQARLSRLVGSDGEVLDALQELTRLAVQTRTGERSRLMLDIAGHRAGRRRELTELAEQAIAQVRSTGEEVSLPSMNPFERKVVHDAVAAAELVSDSEGVEPHRRVVIRAESS
ncbi:protein jag [Pseudactinotalea sp. Z1732]|uniref:Jag family protein n=1 Tax=Micrococcales TaxID=85006 RepID=UPI003C7C6643